jgi:3-mercaptopyruvate sulfurtransferase SseA
MNPSRRVISSSIALVLMGLAVALALAVRPTAGSGLAEPASGATTAATGMGTNDLAWTAQIEQAEDHISPEDLADRVVKNPNATLLIDVRPADEFAAFHLRDAKNLSLPELLGGAGRALIAAAGDRLVVLYSNGMTHPAQAWAALSAAGVRNVRVLEDGLDGLLARVLTPPSLRPGITEARARAERPAFEAAMAALVGGTSNAATAAMGPRGVYSTDPASLTTPTVVSTAWVASHHAELVVVDARDATDAFEAGHLPGAVSLPYSALRASIDGVPEQVRSATELAQLLGQAGLTADAQVVVYAGEQLHDAAQTVMALLVVGHERVAILEGGIDAWRAEGRPVETGASTRAAATYTPRLVNQAWTSSLGAVVAALQQKSSAVVDARPADAFRGQDAGGSKGHMPGAISRPMERDLVTAGGTWWRPREELVAAYGALGVSPERPVIVTCRTGHRAALTYFTLRYLLGWNSVQWFDGSFAEWADHTELPVAAG